MESAREGCGAVGRQLKRGNRQAVVAQLARDLPGLKIRSVRDPHVALASGRKHPCDSPGMVGRGHKIR